MKLSVILGGIISICAFVGAVYLLPSSAMQPHTLRVVAAENVWGDIVKQIGGSNVQVTSLIADAKADPHEYEPTARDAAAVATADIVITNGLHYDDFINKLLASSPNQSRVVITVADVLDASGDDNPHFWYDIPRIHQVAATITAQLNAKDPAHAAIFADNLKTFVASLQPLLNQMSNIRVRFSGVSVAYTERVAGYLLDAAGLNNKTPNGFARSIEDGTDPSPADQHTLLTLLTNHDVRLLIYNPQTSSPASNDVQRVATQDNIATTPVTESLPANLSYQSWQKMQLDAIVSGLNNTKQ